MLYGLGAGVGNIYAPPAVANPYLSIPGVNLPGITAPVIAIPGAGMYSGLPANPIAGHGVIPNVLPYYGAGLGLGHIDPSYLSISPSSQVV